MSRGCFLGLSTDVTRGVLFRAVLEGLALEYRYGLAPLLHHAGVSKLDAIYATGGGTRNRLLMQIKASVLNQSYRMVSIDEATALGAAVLGGLAAGLYNDVDDAVSHMRYTVTEIEPIPEQTERYYAIYEHGLPAHLPNIANAKSCDLSIAKRIMRLEIKDCLHNLKSPISDLRSPFYAHPSTDRRRRSHLP